MTPPPGERLVRFVGDCVRFSLAAPPGGFPGGWQARLRTNLGRAAVIREEVVKAYFHQIPPAGASWRDLPMQPQPDGSWALELPLTEVGWFKSKAYILDDEGFQHWPEGPDFGINVLPDEYRTGNTIYCAFVRMFGPSKTLASTADAKLEAGIKELDECGYTVIPPSGTLRDLQKELPHIIGTLGCRIVHLLPVNPTPTTYARFGRFGSPYAIQDLTAIDPALVEFDKRTTGVDQFCELAADIHQRGARLFLDVVINHTGWGSSLQENHPGWFLKQADGEFASPGAWGNTWADLVELEHKFPELWETIAQAFLVWCRRGVDGFRCDAGYKVPMHAWQYIIARVRQEFPGAVFLLEGLGGGWNDTENLLTEGGMQWAYSELFQEFSAHQLSRYLGHALTQSRRVGILVHYSETHDNLRLADKGRAWSLFRNRLCALASVTGGFGFTCGVEWLAPERVNVHSSRGLAWGNGENIIQELAALTRLLAEHPCFYDDATLTRINDPDAPIYALLRRSAEGLDQVLVLANPDEQNAHTVTLSLPPDCPFVPGVELLGQPLPELLKSGAHWTVALPPLSCVCLAENGKPQGLAGENYRRLRAQAAWAWAALSQRLPAEAIGNLDWRELAKLAAADPVKFLAACDQLAGQAKTNAGRPVLPALKQAIVESAYPRVIRWSVADCRRVTMVPPGHALLIEHSSRFTATLRLPGEALARHAGGIEMDGGWVAAFFAPQPGEGELELRSLTAPFDVFKGQIQALAPEPEVRVTGVPAGTGLDEPMALLTNGIGGMARVCVDLGRVNSKYDCLLGANLHGQVPVDRHVFAKRVRIWCDADGFITPLNRACLVAFQAGEPAHWSFRPPAGDGRSVGIDMTLGMDPGQNTTRLSVRRVKVANDLPESAMVRLTVRVDIEDRSFHAETKRNGGSEHHFASHTRVVSGRTGFEFTPANDRQLRVIASSGRYHPAPEWSQGLPHVVEQSRGQEGAGDGYSPGWFEIPLATEGETELVLTAEADWQRAMHPGGNVSQPSPEVTDDAFAAALRRACEAFVVRRNEGKTIIAGYPWFLDWGRDTLIAARGLLAAGMIEEVKQLLVIFGRFEENGTLPNTIHGENASNRDTVDAALWFGVVCEELGEAGSKFQVQGAKLTPESVAALVVNEQGRTIAEVLRSIAVHHLKGTPNGIRMDAASGLIWSPSHFTWMDTNYPAGTPREGYPVEIQALWIRLLRQLARLGVQPEGEAWDVLAAKAEKSFQTYFWLEEGGYYADGLLGGRDTPARTAMPDQALRSNMLFAVTLGLAGGERARRCVDAGARHLIVPGAIRSLAPLPVTPPLPVRSASGQLLNDPLSPYWGRYEGDEDTRRKPAYHNGTAWVWPFPSFCEALAMAYDRSPEAVAAAKAYLGSADQLLATSCLGHLPEVLDGDAPHQQRGCDAQAWSVTETLRVWEWLNR